MTEERLRYVERIRAKGRDYYYFRRGGHRSRLPGAPGEPAFHERYAALLEGSRIERPRAPAGSVAALIITYRASPEFRTLAATTQQSYELALERIGRLARFQVAEIRRRHVRALRDEFAHTPRTANEIVKVARILFGRAVDDEDIETNPAAGVEPLKTGGGYTPWTDAQCATFEAAHAEGRVPAWAMMAYMLARYTSHARAEVLRMAWPHYDGTALSFTRGKTGAELVIPAHTKLKAWLDAAPRLGLLMVTTPEGRAWDKRNFTKAWRALLDRLGLKGLHLHGLRHKTSGDLAERGASEREIMAVTGHKSPASVSVYTRRAAQKRRAASAIRKLEGEQ